MGLFLLGAPLRGQVFNFDLPADVLERTLKQFADQSGLEVLIPSEPLARVPTQAVRGKMTALEALERMLAGSGLQIVQEPSSGAVTLRKGPPRSSPNSSAVPIPRRSDDAAVAKLRREPPATSSPHAPSRSSTNDEKSMKNSSLAALTAWLVGVLAPATSSTAAETRAPEVAASEPVQLSAFVVNTNDDKGWLAGNTMLSNRTNQALKDVPASIEALTAEFLADVGAYTDVSAAKWAANVLVASEEAMVGVVGTGSGSPPDFGRIAIRGITNSTGTTRNFFRWYVPNDGYNVDRIDFGRGSNTLLYGNNEAGGQGTVYTKRAVLGKNFGETLLQVGSFDSYRANVDYNWSISKKVAARLNATYNTAGRDFDFNEFEFRGAHGALIYVPFANTQIRVEGEAGAHRRVWGTNNQTIHELLPPGMAFQNKWTVELQTMNVVNNALGSAADRAQAPSGSANLNFLENNGGFPRRYNWGGPDHHYDRRFTTVSAYVEQRVGPLGVELAFNQQHQWYDQTGLEGGTNLLRRTSTGRRFVEYFIQDFAQENLVQNLRGTATYRWSPRRWMSQLFVGTAEMRTDRFKLEQWLEKNEFDNNGGSLSGLPSRVWYRVYVDEAGAYSPRLLGRQASLPSSAAFNRIMFNEDGRAQYSVARAYSLSASGLYFGGRLQSMIGYRWDGNKSLDSVQWLNANRLARGARGWSGYYDEHPERFSATNGRPVNDATSRNLALVYVVNPRINVYASYATSFRAGSSSSVNLINGSIPPEVGKTYELGVKSDFFNRKLVWNLTAYDLNRQNVPFSYTLTGINNTQLEDLFNPNGLAATDPSYVRIVNSQDIREQFSKGFESTFTYYPGMGLNIRISGAYKKVTQDKSLQLFKSLLASAVGRGNENAAYVAAANQTVDLNGGDGLEIAGRIGSPFTFNYAVNYSFPSNGWLRGVSLGVNGAYEGGYVLSYFKNQPVRGGQLLSLNGTAAYSHKLFDRAVTYRLNVQNLLETEYLTAGLVPTSNGSYVRRTVYGSPLSVTLTANIRL
jgi:outer membrane receptor protein involved in Fe transport